MLLLIMNHMPDKRKIVLYFGLAGILPFMFFTIQSIVSGNPPSGLFWGSRIATFFMSFVTTASISASVIYGPIRFLEKNLPWQGNLWKRMVSEGILTNLMAITAMMVIHHLLWLIGYNDVVFGSQEYYNSLWLNIAITVIMNFFLVAVYEGIVLFSMWKSSIIQNERLEKENVISKFETLKNQVNPHFLFNSLNALSNLVHEDPDRAEDFIDEFSDIYRYILEKKDQLVVPLKEELEFVKAYLKLCNLRFGDALISEIKIDVNKIDSLIPTLSLQTLVENAIKHNKVTIKEPLTLKISTEDSMIIVTNNYQPRQNLTGDSTGIGINNISERYAILSDIKPEFYIDNKSYIAKLPLMPVE